MIVATKILLLFAGHALCDYPLQGDFLAKGKNHKSPLPGIPWYQCMGAHAVIHAGMVYLVTRSLTFASLEFVVHFWTDFSKCDGALTFNQDQAVHYAFKVLWAVL